MSSMDLETFSLLLTLLLALGVACSVLIRIFLQHRRELTFEEAQPHIPRRFFPRSSFPQRPATWLAIRSATPESVQFALGMNRPAPCPWAEGMAGEHEFFISPRVNGWVIVTGLALPDPGDDVDGCFLFLTALSRKLGHVQFFHAEKISRNHAWARLDDGCVTRAYAWAGETVWNQGAKTMPEIELGLKCFAYGDISASKESAEMNFQKVAALAARWSFDPAVLQRVGGIAGESPRFY